MVKEWLSREQDCVVKECKYIARSLPRPGEFTMETKSVWRFTPRDAMCFLSMQCWSVEDQVLQIPYDFSDKCFLSHKWSIEGSVWCYCQEWHRVDSNQWGCSYSKNDLVEKPCKLVALFSVSSSTSSSLISLIFTANHRL